MDGNHQPVHAAARIDLEPKDAEDAKTPAPLADEAPDPAHEKAE